MIRKVLLPFFIPFLCIFSGAAGSLAADTADDLIKEAGRAIGQCLKERGDLKLAVTGIRASDGRANGLTEYLEDSLTSELAANSRLKLLERKRLKEVTKEIGLSLGDPLYDQKNAMELGKRLSAQIMVSGTLTKMGKTFDLSLRVVDCKEGDIISGCGLREKVAVTPDLLDLWRRFVPGPLGASQPEIKSKRVSLFKYESGKSVSAGNPPVFKIGDGFGFCVRPPMKSRLYVLTYDPDRGGDVVFLYPLPNPPSRPAGKDETCVFPAFAHPEAVSYPMGGPEGRAELKAIWVEEGEGGMDLEGTLKDRRKPGLPNYTLSKEALSGWVKQIEVLPAASWGEETVAYWIETSRFKGGTK